MMEPSSAELRGDSRGQPIVVVDGIWKSVAVKWEIYEVK